MQSNEPFPLELFPPRVRESILAEFQGRHPTILQVAKVSDAQWLGCPMIGPNVLARIRSFTQGLHQRARASTLSAMNDAELLARLEFLQEELERIRAEIKAGRTELWTRGIPPTTLSQQLPKSRDRAVHQGLG